MKIKIAEEDPNPSTGIQKKMEDIEEDQGVEKVQEDEKEENIKEHLDLALNIIIDLALSIIIDLALSIIHREGIIGLAQGVNTVLDTHLQIEDDQTADPEVVIMTKRRQGEKGMIVEGRIDTGA